MNIIKKILYSGMTLISPMLNTRVLYLLKFKRKLDLENPVTLNEKGLWLKFNTYWNNPLVKQCADKLAVREYLKDTGCEEILNDLIGVYDSFEEIKWNELPNQFALKLNVGCGCNLIVNDKSRLNLNDVRKKLKHWKRNHDWLYYSEMQYKGVKKKYIIEKYLGSESGELPLDYKFYCFNGKSKYVMTCVGRGTDEPVKYFYFDRDWNMMSYTHASLQYPDYKLPKPEMIDEAFEWAEKLSKPFPFVRVDLYIVDGKVYFGELTFTPSASLDNGRIVSTDIALGNMLNLPL